MAVGLLTSELEVMFAPLCYDVTDRGEGGKLHRVIAAVEVVMVEPRRGVEVRESR